MSYDDLNAAGKMQDAAAEVAAETASTQKTCGPLTYRLTMAPRHTHPSSLVYAAAWELLPVDQYV